MVPDGPAAGTRVDVHVDDTWVTQLDLGDGRIGTVEANYSSHGTHAAELELMGTDGTLALSLLDVAAPIEVLTDGEWTRVDVPRTGRAEGPDHLVGVEHLLDRIVDEVKPELTPAHAIHVLDIVEQAERSAREGVVASLGTTFDH